MWSDLVVNSCFKVKWSSDCNSLGHLSVNSIDFVLSAHILQQDAMPGAHM